MSLGSALKKHRKRLKITVRDVESDINVTNVSRYENNLASPSFKNVVKLARYYKININELEKEI